MLHAVHDAMSDGADRCEDRLRLEPVQQESDRRAVIGGGKTAGGLRRSSRITDDRFVPLSPMRSIFAARRRCSVLPASYTANRMLDEPPLIVRTQQGTRSMMPSLTLPAWRGRPQGVCAVVNISLLTVLGPACRRAGEMLRVCQACRRESFSVPAVDEPAVSRVRSQS